MKTLKVHYYNSDGSLSHTYEESWDRTQLYCLNCGQQSVDIELGAGDYYQGNKLICTTCKYTWQLPVEPSECVGSEDLQRLKELSK